MLYNGEYIKDSLNKFTDQFDKDYEKAEYTVEIDGIFRDPPIILLCQYMDKAGDPEYQDLMIRHCILGKTLTVYLDGNSVGKLNLNTITDPWELVPWFSEHPLAYMAINNVVMSYLAKKLVLPRKKTNAPGATGKVK